MTAQAATAAPADKEVLFILVDTIVDLVARVIVLEAELGIEKPPRPRHLTVVEP